MMKHIKTIVVAVWATVMASCGEPNRQMGWYLMNEGARDSIARTPIVRVSDFRGLMMDSVETDDGMIYTINGGLKPEGKAAFANATRQHAGKKIGFCYEQKIIDNPRVNGEIRSGCWQIVLKNQELAMQVYFSLLDEMGSEADEAMPDAAEAAMEEPFCILPNTTPITYRQHADFTNLLAEIMKRYAQETKGGKVADIRKYPEFGQISKMGEPVVVPLLFIMINKENYFLLPLYDAIQKKELTSALPYSQMEEKMEETITLFVEKVLKQKRHRFASESEKVKAVRDLLKEKNLTPDTSAWSEVQLDSIYMQYDYDLFKATLAEEKI